MISIWYRVLFYDVSILCSVVYNVDIKLGPPPIKSSHFLAELPTSKFHLWELFSLHLFGASRLKLVKFFRTTHMRERCALPTSKFRLWERFSLHVFVRRFAPENLPHNTLAGALRAPHVQNSPVGALRAPHFWRCAPGIFPHTSPISKFRL